MCRRLGRTKGAFYHRFPELADYHDALLARWEHDLTERPIALAEGDPDPARRHAQLGEVVRGLDHRLDLAVRAWALREPRVRAVMDRVDARRIEHLAELWAATNGRRAGALTLARLSTRRSSARSSSIPTSRRASRAGSRPSSRARCDCSRHRTTTRRPLPTDRARAARCSAGTADRRRRRGLAHRCRPAFATAVRDALRVRLLVGDLAPDASSAADRAPPRVLEYAGHGPFLHWVLVAAFRLGYDLERRRGDREDPTPDLDAIWGDDPERSVVRRESRALLEGWMEEALRALDDRRRAVIHLYFVEDVSSEAIARMYGVHRGTVAGWVEEAKEAVRSSVRRRALATPGLGPEEIDSIVRAADGHLSLSSSFLRA